MNNPRLVADLLNILSHELGYDSSPELVGWQPAPTHFDSSEFFREDAPMETDDEEDIDFVPDMDISQIHAEPHEYTPEEIDRIKQKYSKFAEPLNIEKE